MLSLIKLQGRWGWGIAGLWGSCVMLSHKNYGIQGKWSLVWGLGKATSKDSHAVAFLQLSVLNI